MSLPAGVTDFRADVYSDTYDEAVVNATGTVTPDTWTLSLRAWIPGAGDPERMFDYVQAVMEHVKDRLETEFALSTFSTSGSFSGVLPGDPWTA